MRAYLLGVCCLAVLSCREIQSIVPPVTVQGYQLNGTVTTSNGIPLDSVDVTLYYTYVLFGRSPIDTQTVYVDDSTKFVDISVYTTRNVFVRRLFFGFRNVGPVPRFRWNGTDDNGNLVPSAEYIVRYTIDTAVVKQSPVLINGNSTASTDGSGQFTILNDHLPIGLVVDVYDLSGNYLETDRVLSRVILEFNKSNLHAVYSIEVIHNQITSRVFTLP